METNRESTNLRELVYIRRRPIIGRSTRAVSSRIVNSKSNIRQSLANNVAQDSKSCDFVCYSDSEDEEDLEKSIDISCSFVHCNQNRQLGLNRKFQHMQMSSEYATRHILSNSMMREYEITIGNMNKVFSSQWLSHKQVLFGTKCNKLMVLDVTTKRIDQIPSLESREGSRPLLAERGVNSIEINPSKTLITTGASNSNDVAVYRLPTLDPVVVGGRGHQDWIFDQTWIDDQFFVSGSRDGSISLWRVTDEMLAEMAAADLPKYSYMEPLLTKACKQADKVRALCYNNRTQEIAVISPNHYIHCWNALNMKQIMSKKLPHQQENCCLSVDEDCQMYAVGSKSHTDLLDSRSLQSIRKIPSRNGGCGIRSVSFKGNILTIGTGTGLILFWDLRANKFLESTINSNRVAQLKAGRGWVKRDDSFLERYEGSKYMPAIYTQCYDSSGTRLFAAGGPLQNSQMGNYVGLFQ
eukprot:TRINITY_DN2375_c0_g1_i11.p1 TRINITY_DN2375_c0_g1~~TRINITY_DN2375_c0_g1_i11.p1  ORF type:complete len:467 (-),score=86.19 TRINITY_DN2375_c0_g1_i11:443-1843(-)